MTCCRLPRNINLEQGVSSKKRMEVQITQKELREIVYLQRDIDPKIERLEQLKSNVKAMLSSGLQVELGRFDASLVYRHVRNPAWKQVVIDNLGPQFAEDVYRNTPGHTICDVKVEEHAVRPLWNDGEDDDAEKEE
jgi:hypothetical protein